MKKWDDNTDKKIRDSLDNLNFSFDEASWDKMDAKLNKSTDRPVGAFVNKYGYLILIFLLFVSVSALYSVSNYYGFFDQDEHELTAAKEIDLIHKEIIAHKNEINTEQTKRNNKQSENTKRTDTDLVIQNNLTPVNNKSAKSKTETLAENDNSAQQQLKPKLRTSDRPVNQSIVANQMKPAIQVEAFSIRNNADTNTRDGADQDVDVFNPLISKSRLTLTESFFGDGGIAGLTLASDDYNFVPVIEVEEKLTKEEKRQERANSREIRKKLGNSYRAKGISGTGKFSLKPLNWGVRLGAGFGLDRYFLFELENGRVGRFFPLNFQGIHAGLFAQYVIHNKWHLQTEFTYSRLSQVFESFFLGENRPGLTESLESSYDFQYELKGLEFLDIQAVLQYKLRKRGMFELGGAFGLTIPEYFFSGSVSWRQNTLRRQPLLIGPENAILKYNLQAIVGYQYRITNRFSLNARYYFGLLDLTNESFFRTPTNNHQDFDGGSRLQFSLIVKLNRIRKKEEKE